MTQHTVNLEQLLKSRQQGYSLEAPFYNDEAIFKADIKHIFNQHWIFVAVEPQIPEEGDYVTVEVGARSVIIARDDDMGIKAFHNVCRHRGSRLCKEHSGSIGNLVCPYHQWTYNLEGDLISAEHMGDDFDFKNHGLKTVHVRSLEGLIFICLADNPPTDFDDMVREMSPYLAPHRLKDCKVAAQVDIIEDGNWKLTMENNRECYHCVANHPELTVSLYEYGFGYQPNAKTAQGMAAFNAIMTESHAKWQAMGLPSKTIDLLTERDAGYRTVRLPIDGSGQSQTLNTQVACKKLLGDLTESSLGGLSFWTQPNSWHHFMSDHVVSFTVLPISAGKTLVRTTWCVHKDAVEGIDYDVANLTAVWNATNDQDRRLIEECQKGVNNPEYQPGPYSPYTEELVDKFCTWYNQRLAQGISNDK